mgnify:CR=1 FL=1
MKIKKGDNVIVIAGKDKGKTGVVARAFPVLGRVTIEGVNVQKKHQRARGTQKKGQIIEKEASIDVSNVMLVDPKGGKRTRVGITRKDGARVRVAKKSNQEV